MTQFKVDLPALQDMAARLRGAQEEFESLEDRIGGHRDAIRSDVIASSLENFASNWSDARRDIIEQIQNVAGYAGMAADAYAATEGEISDAFDGSQSSSSRPAGSAG